MWLEQNQGLPGACGVWWRVCFTPRAIGSLEGFHQGVWWLCPFRCLRWTDRGKANLESVWRCRWEKLAMEQENQNRFMEFDTSCNLTGLPFSRATLLSCPCINRTSAQCAYHVRALPLTAVGLLHPHASPLKKWLFLFYKQRNLRGVDFQIQICHISTTLPI